MFDFSVITSWIHGLLTSFLPLGVATFVECVAIGGCLLLMYTVIAILMIFMERKVCAAFQCRLGPVRVGPWGTLQVIGDVYKMLTMRTGSFTTSRPISSSWLRCWPSPACR